MAEQMKQDQKSEQLSIRIKGDCSHDRWTLKKDQIVNAPADIPLAEAKLLIARGNAESADGAAPKPLITQPK
jgi:hypothetical protein